MGKPFEHFRNSGKTRYEKPSWKDGQVVESAKSVCTGRAVSKCVVDLHKQDGHHELSNYTRLMLTEHPTWRSALGDTGNLNLFVNWHPAPLGHEVIANQIAYYHLGVMAKAVEMILS